MSVTRHILVLRFSALGDVAMTIPVIKQLLQQNTELQITYVSNPFVQPLFEGIDRLHFYPADFKGEHKGIYGLIALAKQLKKINCNAVADLHDALRTKLLRLLLSPSENKISVINKGRPQKKELTRRKNKQLHPLPSTFQRYADVFTKLGLPLTLQSQAAPLYLPETEKLKQYKAQGFRLIGVAPFAKHAEKMYPLVQMKEVVNRLAGEKNAKLFLFGSRAEAPMLQTWAQEFESVESVAGKMDFCQELNYIAAMHLMISMDSANMHLASLFGVPVVSVWGATHPFAGFYGWQQHIENAVQVNLYCRPCSVFGNRTCYRGDWACMHAISPQMIYERAMQQLNKNTKT